MTLTAIDRLSSSERAMLRHHLGYNHFPPVSPDFDYVAAEAIEAGRDEDWGREITLPTGTVLTACEVVEQLHLDGWLHVEVVEVAL